MTARCRGQSFSLESKLAVGLTSGRNFHADRLSQGRRHDVRTEGGFPRPDRQCDVQIAALFTEDRIRQDGHSQIEIPTLTAVHAGLAFAGHAHPGAILDAGGNTDFDGLGLHDGAGSQTGRAGSSLSLPAALAGRAGHRLSQSEALGYSGHDLS